MTIASERPVPRREFRLEERYTATHGPALLTGVQAVCRVPLDVRRVDERRGLDTRAFMTGYQGSPLGTVDFAMRPITKLLESHGVDFRPGMNEMMAATAVLGTQAVTQLGSELHGVAGFWYGKAPGVDQALDAIRHGNLMGTHASGGVVAFCGDDATAKSSTVPCGSETVLRAALIPTLAPADSQDVLDYGLHGIAMSRASGLWTAVKIATNVADGSSVVHLDVDGFAPRQPLHEGRPYEHQVATKLGAALAEAMEQNLHQVRMPLVLEYARLNGLNRIVARGPQDRIGIVATGEPYLEVRQALADMGLVTDDELAAAGVRVLKVGLVWPLEPQIVRAFADGLDEIVVVEDKGPFLEQLVKDELFNSARRPAVVGTRDTDGAPLLPSFGAVDADAITKAVAPRLLALGDRPSVRARLDVLTAPTRSPLTLTLTPVKRTPYFCSGCPHNTSTKAPEGSLMGGGIGCHAMTVFMEPSQTGTVTGLTQMGGEGAQWIGQQDYVTDGHSFQNLGDGTLAHSGLLAIRASVAAGTDITYKILYNSAVAMTGGQDAVGGYTVPQLARTLEAEGVRKIVITSDHPENYRGVRLPKVASVHDRDALMTAQEELRTIKGTTVLIHDQPCAAELRRKRKRGQAPDPAMRVMINERVCEGCGDCGQKSNCLSVTPVETVFGRKTHIDQASCNKDYSCLKGDCPSFMEVIPGPVTKRKARRAPALESSALPEPRQMFAPDGFTVRITGIGGTGIVTVAQVLATAGFVDGLSPRGLDQVGLSQKAGPVVSDLRFAVGERPLSPKLSTAGCDLYLGCDVLVGGDPKNLATAHRDRTVAIVSTADVPSGAMVRRPETAFPDHDPITAAIDAKTRPGRNAYVDAKALAAALLGGDQFANMLLVGAAYQAGALPLTEEAIERAIELNGVAVEANIQAFRRGRQAVADPEALATALEDLRPRPAAAPEPTGRAAELIEAVGAGTDSELAASLKVRVPDLIDYQNEIYAARYTDLVAKAHRAEQKAVAGRTGFAEAVAFCLHKLMAYKDEYEVARLSLDKTERARITAEFGEGAKVRWKLHPPVLRAMGMKNKLSLGRWFTVFYVILRWAKWTRGTKLDLFGYAKVRRVERDLIAEYTTVIEELISTLTPANHELAVQIAELPDLVRGYEHIKLGNVETYRQRLAELRDLMAR
ncbi:indolepyruvate ferredoxin oxidoreductase family protein [Streptomyces sp. SID13726]|uniref:indolepyruvate ferredoxin oxidoreductase family protein n=1 Tax=Streptomyces sp. SID13726 TaxID=2706058 RepID=UPI0013B7349F|nr:indolepyruvate ferredoxin oxidoreductase family protein [Streptomyces sp. SID13726]NEB04185.1 indolepyruvate ferredoxin oxidoreductase family protein [Streptomyces sp. SID13726]